MQEVFDFVECADPEHKILWNIESKINPQYPNRTLGVEDFVTRQHALFSASFYASQITVRRNSLIHVVDLNIAVFQYQSFDWRTLTAMKVVASDGDLRTSAHVYAGAGFEYPNLSTHRRVRHESKADNHCQLLMYDRIQ